MTQICYNCEWARLAGNKGDDVVGCALMHTSEVRIKDVKHGPTFAGWMHCNRRPSEKQGGIRPFDSALVYGPHLIASTATCFRHTSLKEAV